jgi:hypothetical protein
MADEVVVLAIILAFVGFLLWLMSKRSALQIMASTQRQQTLRAVVERFGSSEELLAFVHSPDGQKLLGSPAEPYRPLISVLRFVQSGIALLFVGAGLRISAWTLRFGTDINDIHKAVDHRNWGTLCGVAGVALLVVAGVSHALARKWGLVQPKP